MRTRVTVLVLVVCAAALAAAAAATRGASAAGSTPPSSPWTRIVASAAADAPIIPGAQRIVVEERDGDFRFVDADGSGGESRGDYFISTSNLFSTGGTRVGRDWVKCTLTFLRATQCEATLELFGRGTIEVAGVVTDRAHIAITGGSGEFGDAGGQLNFGGDSRLVLSVLHLS
jgi:hypothetical protein